jgi:hypothetical protein
MTVFSVADWPRFGRGLIVLGVICSSAMGATCLGGRRRGSGGLSNAILGVDASVGVDGLEVEFQLLNCLCLRYCWMPFLVDEIGGSDLAGWANVMLDISFLMLAAAAG